MAPNSIAQKAAVTAFTTDLRPSLEMTKRIYKKKGKSTGNSKRYSGCYLHEPDGAFYIFPDVSAYYGKSDGETDYRIMQMICACIF